MGIRAQLHGAHCRLGLCGHLAATKAERPSVIQVRSDLLTPDALGSAVLAAIHQTKDYLENGAIVSIDADRARVRVLPLDDRGA